MSSVKFFSTVCFAMILSTSAFASGGGGHGGGEKKEGEAKEGGEGKAETKKDEFAEATAQVAALKAKVDASQEAIHKLIEEKHETKDPEKVGEVVKSLVNEHKALQKNAEAYEQARAFLQYRFPEKGMKEKRNYERVEVKSLEEMENQQSLESRIKRTLGKVRKQYDAPEPTKKASASKGAKKKHGHGAEEKEKAGEGPSISDPVILTK